MHLSALSDGFVSDSIRDSAAPTPMSGGRHDAAGHAAGLVRGIAFAAALACPVTLAVVPSWLHHRSADAGFAEVQGHTGGNP